MTSNRGTIYRLFGGGFEQTYRNVRWVSLHFCLRGIFKSAGSCFIWLDSVSSSGRRWEISCGLKLQKVKTDAEMNSENIKDRKRTAHCSDMIPNAPSSVVPRPPPPHGQTTTVVFKILISFTPGRRTAFAVAFKCWLVLFPHKKKCLSWNLKTEGVTVTGLQQGRCQGGFNFLFFSVTPIWKGNLSG